MRTIKFRIWNGLVMVYEVTVGIHGIFYTNGISTEDSASLDNTTMYPQSTPLMQFTGLKDKNGKEIYEGDVVKISNKPYKVNDSVVVWGKRSNGWSLKCEVIKDNSYDPEIKYYSLESGKHLKIIGNIHENPELLQ